MIGQLLPNTNEILQCILALQILDLNTASVSGSDENSLGNRGGSPPVMRRIYFFPSRNYHRFILLWEKKLFFLGELIIAQVV
jgi:hypothetical protein